MNLKKLREAGAFLSPAPVKRQITWKHAGDDGESHEDTFDIFVMKLSYGVIDSLTSEKDQRSRNAALIAEAIRLGDNAKERLSYEDAYQLQTSLAMQFIVAIVDVNKLPSTKEEASPKE